MRGSGEGRALTVIIMTTQDRAQSRAPVTYIDADGTPIEAPSGLDADAGRTGSGARTSMFAHPNDAVEEPSLAEAMKAMWRAGMAWATFVFVIGLLMVVLSSGLVAVVLWPLGTFTMIVAASVLWATITARRMARDAGARRP